MPRKAAPKFKRKKRGTELVGNLIILTCYQCNAVREFRRDGRDTDEVLDLEAPGWYTLVGGIALCPKDVAQKGITQASLNPYSECIHGDPVARQQAIARCLDHTQRIMERARWKSVTSDDSTTSEIC
jgi:hypothetical protein